ncbi:MAG: site-2 protease family protein [Myxococcales bacterium]|nr:site-2 protease family protein [Myxococcales bacterium]
MERFTQASVLALVGISAADLRQVAIYVVCLVIAISIHEFAHAFTADRLGDPTPSREGRLTLIPFSHADPIGTLALPVMAALFRLPLLGWGRPVPTQPSFYTRKISMRGGLALVAFAGPLSNFLQAILTLGVLKLLRVAGVSSPGLDGILAVFFQLNLVLMAFNLLPLHPLDGGKILSWLLPPKLSYIDAFFERWGGLILLILVVALPEVLHLMLSPIFKAATWLIGLLGL